MRSVARLCLSLLVVVVVGCGDDDGGGGNGDAGSGNGDGGPGNGDGGPFGECDPVDFLIVLDATMSMHRLPDGSQPNPNNATERAKSKWHIAVAAIESVTGELESGVRFGLSRFPLEPASSTGQDCVTVEERTGGTTADNTACQLGEVLVSPMLDAASAIDAAIDPDTTKLCTSTPIGGGLSAAGAELASVKVTNRDQYALLITDGQDTCDGDGGYTTDSLPEADALFASGIQLYVVGFDGTGGNGIDPDALNDLACAGGTAIDPDVNCEDNGNGVLRAVADPEPEYLFLLAEDSDSLRGALDDVAADLCCGCVE